MKIDVFHDTACPWCRIGKKHLKLALEEWEGEAVEVEYHTFFLNPNIPPEGHEFRPYMNAKGSGQVPMEQWFAAPRERGEAVGLTFNFEQIEQAPNTQLSHQLIAMVPDEVREALMDAIYDAYFEHGRNIGDIDVLVAIAAEHDLDAEQIREQLESGECAEHVMEQYQHAQRLGVTGVPFFVFDNTLAFSGAQPPETILRVMRQVEEKHR